MKTDLYSELIEQFEVYSENREKTVEAIWIACRCNFNSTQIESNTSYVDGDLGSAWKDTSFYPITEMKVMAAVAQISDVLFRGNSFPYSINSTPIEDSPMNDLLEKEAINPEGVQVGLKIEDRIASMKKHIDDIIIESKAVQEALKAIYSGALYGTSVIESPFIVSRKRRIRDFKRDVLGNNKATVTIKEQTQPSIRNLNVWDFFPDPENDGDAQKGMGCFHREFYSKADLKDLEAHWILAETEYDKKQFNLLFESAYNASGYNTGSSTSEDPSRRDIDKPYKGFEMLKYCGKVQNSKLIGYIKDLPRDTQAFTEVIVFFSREGHILTVEKNPYPAQKRPFHMVAWNDVPGSPWGIGVGQKLFHVQANINNLLRLYMDNKNLSGNVLFAIDKHSLDSDTDLAIYPGKGFEFDSTEGDISRVLKQFIIQDVTGGVLEAISQMIQWADQASGVPRVLEGQPGTKESTAYAESQRILAASKQLGLVLKNYDNQGWVPIIESIYDWLMEFGEEERAKGDFAVNATGFSNFESKNLKVFNIEKRLQMYNSMPVVQAFTKIKALLDDLAEAENVEPSKYYYTEEEVQQKTQREMQQQAKMQSEATQNAFQMFMAQLNATTQAKIAEKQVDVQGMLEKENVKAASKMEMEDKKQKFEALKELSSREKDDEKTNK